MTLNTFDDGEALLSKELDSLVNAINRDYVKSGLVASKGAGNYDVDVTSGTVVIGGVEISAGADTITLTDPASDPDLDAGEFRVDLLSVDDTGTINVSEGVAAVSPISPDIPTDEVPITLVIVDGSGSSLSAGDIRDARTIADFGSVVTPIYGDASDGTITRTTSGNENGLLFTDKYEIESGVTRTVTNGVVVIHATDSITVDGTLTAVGQAATAGTGGAGGNEANGSNGNAGANGDLTEVAGAGGTGATTTNANGGDGGQGAGGGGGASANQNGGDGAQGGTTKNFTDAQIRRLRQFLTDTYDSVYDLSILAGAGGGGGGGGAGETTAGTGVGGDGGDGGDGGGVIVLAAPTIKGTGTVSSAGESGQNGQNGQSGEGAGGGGGGGGSGGAVVLVSPDVNTGLTRSASGGTGGTGGSGLVGTGDGGDGGDGANGFVIEIN